MTRLPTLCARRFFADGRSGRDEHDAPYGYALLSFYHLA